MSFDFALGFICGATAVVTAVCFLMAAYRAGQKKGAGS